MPYFVLSLLSYPWVSSPFLPVPYLSSQIAFYLSSFPSSLFPLPSLLSLRFLLVSPPNSSSLLFSTFLSSPHVLFCIFSFSSCVFSSPFTYSWSPLPPGLLLHLQLFSPLITILFSSCLLSFPFFLTPLLSSSLLSSPLLLSRLLLSLQLCPLFTSPLSSPLSLFPLSTALAGSNPSFVLCGWMNVTGLHTKQAGSLALGRAQRLNRITHIQSLCHSNAPAPRGPMIDTPRRQRT